MWSEACELLTRAERLQRELFRPVQSGSGRPVWQPPVDMLETNDEVLILMALPGVDPKCVEVIIDEDHLVVSGSRVLPAALRTAVIHRLELPQGRFERRVGLPAGRYTDVQRDSVNGCLLITLRKG
jgi:HSP20 family molecular chaperone IbpA